MTTTKHKATSLAERAKRAMAASDRSGDLRSIDSELALAVFTAVATSGAWTDDDARREYAEWVAARDIPTHASVAAQRDRIARTGGLRGFSHEDVHNVFAIYLHKVASAAPSGRVRRNPTGGGNMPPGFDSFDASDLFGVEVEPVAETALDRATAMVGALPAMRDAHEILADDDLLTRIDNTYYYWQRQGVWFIRVRGTPDQAIEVAKRVQRKLRARTKLPSSVPIVHDKRLLVGATDLSVFELPPVLKR